MGSIANCMGGHPHLFGIIGSGQRKLLESANEGSAAVFLCPKAGNIDRIGVYVQAVSATPPTGVVHLRNVAVRLPTTSLGSQTFTPAVGMQWVTLTTPIAVTKDQLVAATIEWSAGAGNTFTINERVISAAVGLPFLASKTAGTWESVGTYAPLIAARYDDGLIVGGHPLIGPDATAVIHADTDPDEIGMRWPVSDAYDVIGYYLATRQTYAGSEFEVCLYRGTTLLRSVTIPGEANQSSTANSWRWGLFDSPVTLEPGDHIISMKPTTGGAIYSIQVNTNQFGDADIRESRHGVFYRTDRVDGGAWSTGKTDEAVLIYPLIGALPSAGGGATAQEVWEYATRTITGFTAAAKAEIQAEVDAVVDPMKDDGVAEFDRATDSLQAIKDDAATLAEIATEINDALNVDGVPELTGDPGDTPPISKILMLLLMALRNAGKLTKATGIQEIKNGSSTTVLQRTVTDDNVTFETTKLAPPA